MTLITYAIPAYNPKARLVKKKGGKGTTQEQFLARRMRYLNAQAQQFQHRIMQEKVENIYKIGKKLGKGAFGIVHIVNRKCFKNKKFALKIIHRDRLRSDVSLLEKELQLLISLDHPNIIDFDELYMDDQNFAFVTQYCKGGDLFHQQAKQATMVFPESTAAKIVKQILLAIKYCHDRGVCHRDLKLENIMIEEEEVT